MRCTSSAGALRGDGNCRRSYSATAPPASNRARQRRTLRGSRPRMSAAWSHVRVPLNARMSTSCSFMARSTAAAASTIGTSLDAYGCTAHRPQSGHFTCSRERTDHLLPTHPIQSLALGSDLVYLPVAFHRPQGLAPAASGPLASGLWLSLDDGTRCQTRFASENEPARQSVAVSCRCARLIGLLGDMAGADCLAQFVASL